MGVGDANVSWWYRDEVTALEWACVKKKDLAGLARSGGATQVRIKVHRLTFGMNMVSRTRQAYYSLQSKAVLIFRRTPSKFLE